MRRVAEGMVVLVQVSVAATSVLVLEGHVVPPSVFNDYIYPNATISYISLSLSMG